jgi:ribonuclease HI
MAGAPLTDLSRDGIQKVILYVDGSCSGNPGEGGAGVVIKDEHGKTIAFLKEYLGMVTNNRAEYQALILGLREAHRLGIREVEVNLDSELVVNQVNGMYRIRDAHLKTLEEEVKRLLGCYSRWVVQYIPREKNREADRLAREAVRDKHRSSGRWS